MATFDRLQNKLCYNVVNVVEAFAVSLVFLLNFMLAPTSKCQTILWNRHVENPEEYSEQCRCSNGVCG